MDLNELLDSHCKERPAGTPVLSAAEVALRLPLVPGWELVDEGKGLQRRFEFDSFTRTMAFVNEVAGLAEEEWHHPDFRIYSYRRLQLDVSTHSIGGLSDNDFIMAAKINRLLDEQA